MLLGGGGGEVVVVVKEKKSRILKVEKISFVYIVYAHFMQLPYCEKNLVG